MDRQIGDETRLHYEQLHLLSTTFFMAFGITRIVCGGFKEMSRALKVSRPLIVKMILLSTEVTSLGGKLLT